MVTRALDDTTFYGYTPDLVAANEKVTVKNQDDEEDPPDIDSPFTDLGSVSKNQYDAITQLYELGVATGISDTSYAPSALMTRAAMAGFMAAMLDHSNARPAGVSMQADKTFDYGEYVSTVMVSVRGDEFGVMSDQLVDIFQNNCVDTCGDAAHFVTSGRRRIGKCKTDKLSTGDCAWNTDDHQTDGNGNISSVLTSATPPTTTTPSRPTLFMRGSALKPVTSSTWTKTTTRLLMRRGLPPGPKLRPAPRSVLTPLKAGPGPRWTMLPNLRLEICW